MSHEHNKNHELVRSVSRKVSELEAKLALIDPNLDTSEQVAQILLAKANFLNTHNQVYQGSAHSNAVDLKQAVSDGSKDSRLGWGVRVFVQDYRRKVFERLKNQQRLTDFSIQDAFGELNDRDQMGLTLSTSKNGLYITELDEDQRVLFAFSKFAQQLIAEGLDNHDNDLLESMHYFKASEDYYDQKRNKLKSFFHGETDYVVISEEPEILFNLQRSFFNTFCLYQGDRSIEIRDKAESYLGPYERKQMLSGKKQPFIATIIRTNNLGILWVEGQFESEVAGGMMETGSPKNILIKNYQAEN